MAAELHGRGLTCLGCAADGWLKKQSAVGVVGSEAFDERLPDQFANGDGVFVKHGGLADLCQSGERFDAGSICGVVAKDSGKVRRVAPSCDKVAKFARLVEVAGDYIPPAGCIEAALGDDGLIMVGPAEDEYSIAFG